MCHVNRTSHISWWFNHPNNTGLFEMIVRVLTTCHTQYTWDRRMCFILFNRTTLQVFVTYLTGALYVHPLWFYRHQHDNRVRSKLSVACQRWWFQCRFWFVHSVPPIHTYPVSWNCAYRLRMELSDGGGFQNLVRNCRWTILPRQSFWNYPVFFLQGPGGLLTWTILITGYVCIAHIKYVLYKIDISI